MESKFKPGDKVSFKNEKLNGVVIDISKGGKIKVMLDDGFDMDVLENELIRVNTASNELNKFYKKEDVPFKDEIPLAIQFGKDGEVNFITLPAEENSVLSGPVIFIIENRTDYSIAFNFSYKNEFDISGIANGILVPKSKYESEKYHRNELKLWTGLHIELLFFKPGNFKPVKPVIKDVSIQLPALQQIQQDLKGRNAFAQFQLLYNNTEQPINVEQLKNAFNNKTKTIADNSFTSDVFSYSSSIEVDLHIESLTDNYSGLSNAEILEMQMITFRNTLNSAIVKKIKTVTFIHGIGDGILKKAILTELKDYNGIKHRPAPMGKYGLGAMEVIL
ncbi:MAG: Smr/MutS family protein [Bacteroidia bacterium]